MFEVDLRNHNTGTVSLLKNDGWQNIMTGVGLKQYDRKEYTEFYLNTILDWQTLIDIYRGEGIGRKIVDVPVKDMLRVSFEVEGDTDHAIPKYLESVGQDSGVQDGIGFYPHLRKALTWSRLFGGSIMVLLVDDGPYAEGVKILEQPLRENSIQKINGFRVYDRRQIVYYPSDIQTDPTKPSYGQPEWFHVFPITSGANVVPMFRVHRSRLIAFKGAVLPERETQQQYTFGDSVLQAVYTRVKGFAGAMSDTEDILSEFIIGVMEIDNLQELISSGQESAVINRLNQVDMSKRIMNTMVVAKEEKYQRLSATVNGIKDILEFFKDTLSAVSGIPQVKLFGEQAQGLGSEAAGNIRLYYDDIADMQVEHILPPIRRVVNLVLKSEDFRVNNKKLAKTKNPTIKFPSLWQMSAKDKAEAQFTQAKADNLYVENGTLTAEEVAKSRFGNKSYSFDTVLIETDRSKIVPPKAADKNKDALAGGER